MSMNLSMPGSQKPSILDRMKTGVSQFLASGNPSIPEGFQKSTTTGGLIDTAVLRAYNFADTAGGTSKRDGIITKEDLAKANEQLKSDEDNAYTADLKDKLSMIKLNENGQFAITKDYLNQTPENETFNKPRKP
jgi:hypothetical protein